MIHCLLVFAQDGDDADKRHAETHADANQLDHIHGANRFEPRARSHIYQDHGAERHANEYCCSWSLHSHQEYHTVRCPPANRLGSGIVGLGKLWNGERTIDRPLAVIAAPAGVLQQRLVSLLGQLA